MYPGLNSIAVCGKGDPKSPETWSRTPASLCEAFENLGVSVVPVDCDASPPRVLELALKALSKAYYLNSRYSRLGMIERPWRERLAVNRVSALDLPSNVLHLYSVVRVPSAAIVSDGRRHFVLTDTTWHLWRQHSTDMANVSSRLAADVMRYEREFFHRARHCFPLSECVRRDLIEHYRIPAEKITVVGSGRGAIEPYFGAKDYSKGFILFVAKARFADKGGYHLVNGFVRARERNPALRLTIVGQPEYEAEFGKIPGITTFGRVSLHQLQRLFNEAALFAMPALNEPWGLVYLEALSCGIPILGLARHAVPEMTHNGMYGFCLPSPTPEAIADALLEAFSNPSRLEAMGRTGQENCVRQFTWEKTAKRILETITKITGPGHEITN